MKKTKRKTFWSEFYTRFISQGRWFFVVIEIGLLGMGLIGGLGALDDIKGEQTLSQAFLWTTLSIGLFLGVAWVHLAKSMPGLREELDQERERARIAEENIDTRVRDAKHEVSEAQIELRSVAADIHHRITEEVRASAEKQANYTIKDNPKLELILGELLARYLNLQLDKTLTFHVTIKRLKRNRRAASRAEVLFRTANQSGARQQRSSVEVEKSLPMRRFDEAFDPQLEHQLRYDHIHEVGALDGASPQYGEELRCLGINTILSFPLREPRRNRKASGLNRLLGFYSIDCSEVGAFSGLFSGKQPKEEAVFDVFYAIADAIATIIMLQPSKSSPKERTSDE